MIFANGASIGEEALNRMLSTCNLRKPRGVRDRAILLLMSVHALGPAEIVGLDLRDVTGVIRWGLGRAQSDLYHIDPDEPRREIGYAVIRPPEGCDCAISIEVRGDKRRKPVTVELFHRYSDWKKIPIDRYRLEEDCEDAFKAWLKMRGDGPGTLFCPVRKSGQMLSSKLSIQGLKKMIKTRFQQSEEGVTGPPRLSTSAKTEPLTPARH